MAGQPRNPESVAAIRRPVPSWPMLQPLPRQTHDRDRTAPPDQAVEAARYRLVALGSHRIAGPGKPAGQVVRRGRPVLRGRIRQLSDRGGLPIAQGNAPRRGGRLPGRDRDRAYGKDNSPTARPRAEAVVEAILGDEAIWTWPDAQGRFRV